MSIELPDCPPIKEATIRQVSFSNSAMPSLGGPETRYVRVGNRFAGDFTVPPPKYAEDGRKWISRLTRGLTETAIVPVPQPGILTTGFGNSPRVKGANQQGKTIIIDGLANGKTFLEGQFLSILIAGQWFLYQSAADVTISGGQMVLPIDPMIRRIPPDNAVVRILDPVMEGFVQGNEQAWSVAFTKRVAIQFSVMERE